jgi:hypothetical protein
MVKPMEKSHPTIESFAVGDRVVYVGSKKRYLQRVGTVFKIKPDGCHVQFDDDPVLASGGVKTCKLQLSDLQVIS